MNDLIDVLDVLVQIIFWIGLAGGFLLAIMLFMAWMGVFDDDEV